MHHPRPCPLESRVTRLLQQLSLRTAKGSLSRIKLSSRELHHDLTHGIAKLALHHNRKLTITSYQQRNYHDSAGMNHILSKRYIPIG